MNKIIIIASLLTFTASTIDLAAKQDYIGILDTQKLRQEVMDKVTKQILQMNLKPLIDQEVQANVKSKLDQKEADDAWKFKRFTVKDWIEYDEKFISEKIQEVMKDLQKKSTIDALWDYASQESVDTALRKFKIDFDLDKKEIKIQTKATDADGKPLFEKKLDPQAGQIDHIQRVAIVNPKKMIADRKAVVELEKSKEVVVHEKIYKEVEAAPVTPAVPVKHGAPIAPVAQVEKIVTPVAQSKQSTTEIKSTPTTVKKSGVETTLVMVDDTLSTIKPENEEEWTQLEKQRDLAYKIVQFFIVLILAAFCLLYKYYKMDQKEKKQESREKREKYVFFGEMEKTPNFDFLKHSKDPKGPQRQKQLDDARKELQDIQQRHQETLKYNQGESAQHELTQSLNSTTDITNLDQYKA